MSSNSPNSPSQFLPFYAKGTSHPTHLHILYPAMNSPSAIPPQCEIIFRQDLRPGDTILPLQSQRLLITLVADTPSELQPIVVVPQKHGHGSISHYDPTAPLAYRPAERTPSSEAIVNPFTPPIDTEPRAQAEITAKPPQLKPVLKKEPKCHRSRRSRL